MEYEYIHIISKIIMIIVPIIMVISIIFFILLMTSSKIRGKMLAKNIKAAKYMMDETKEDLKAINDISAYAQADAIKSKVRAVKQGLQDEIFCKYCGKEIEEDSTYCKYCGEKVR